MDIGKIDKNLQVTNKVDENGIVWHNVTEQGFSVYGLFTPCLYENPQRFVRMDPTVAKTVSDSVAGLNLNTAGGRIRFLTNSKRVCIRLTSRQALMPHITPLGTAGVDMYVKASDGYHFQKAFMPPIGRDSNAVFYESEHNFGSELLRDITLNLPLYSTVEEFKIGLEAGCAISTAPDYKNKLPVVFYGSSITQGGCANRPGNSYQGFLSRRLDMDYINLGFSGSAKGEKEIAQYIAELKMSAFVLDYDHNAPDEGWLRKTHFPFYEIVREKNPTLPIICMSRPAPFGEAEERREIVRNTVEKAKAMGDNNIYFLDGTLLFGDDFLKGDCTVDGCHPTDFGFSRMAKALLPIIVKFFYKEELLCQENA